MTSVGQRCCANGVYVRAANVRRHVWQRKRWRPAGRGPAFFTFGERRRGQCGILVPSQRKQYQKRDGSLAHCIFAVSGSRLPESVEVRAVEEAPEIIYLVLPSASRVGQGGELSD